MKRFEIFPGVTVEVDDERYEVRTAQAVTPLQMPDEFLLSLDLSLKDVLEGESSKNQGVLVVRSK